MDNQHDDNEPSPTNENQDFEQFGPEGGDSRVDELDYYDQQDADDAAERALGVVPAFDPTHDRDDPDAIDPADRALASQAGDWTRRGRLFSMEQARGEPDTRAIYDPEDAHTAVDEVMEIIATRLAPDGSPLAADRNELLYGFVHVLNAQSERLQKRVDNMARELRELIHAQDGSEVRDNDLSQKTDEARNLYDRALAFDRLTNTAALAYERFTDLVWSARERHKSTFSLTEPARAPKVSLADHLKARTWLERTQGTRIAVASGQRPGRELVWATLSRLRNEHPDLVVVTGGNKEGADRYAAEWAKQYDVPLDIVKPDFDAPDFNAELKARNTRIVHHLGEKGRKEEGAAIDGLVVFPGARTGVPGDLVAKARQARVPIAEIENAAQIHNTRGPLMPGYKLDHNEFRPERDPGDTDPARGERRIINAAIAAQTHGPESPRQTISFAIHMLAERVTADGVQLNDEREKLLWGIGNIFYRQIERLNAEARDAASDTDLTPETREAVTRDYDARRGGFIELFREACKIYSREARQPWSATATPGSTIPTRSPPSRPRASSSRSNSTGTKPSTATVSMSSPPAASSLPNRWRRTDRSSTAISTSCSPDIPICPRPWRPPARIRQAVSRMGRAEQHPPDQGRSGLRPARQGSSSHAPKREGLQDLQIRGLIAFGARGALVEDWIARAGNAVWCIDPAAELANLPAPVLAENPDRTWERIRTDYAGLCQATNTKPHLFPYQEGFDDFRGLVAAAIEANITPRNTALGSTHSGKPSIPKPLDANLEDDRRTRCICRSRRPT